MTIAITGASGFLGKNLVTAMAGRGTVYALYHTTTDFPRFVADNCPENVVPIQCDLTDPASVDTMLAEVGEPDQVVWLAAKVDPRFSVEHPDIDLAMNVTALVNVLTKLRCGSLIFFSSGAVYEGLSGTVDPSMPVAPLLPYANAKVACERYVHFFQEWKQSVERYLNIRFFGCFGPHEPARKIYTRLVRAFALEGKQSFTLYGDGTNMIDAMYVDDAVKAILAMLDGDAWNLTANLACGQPLTLQELARRTAALFGIDDVALSYEGEAAEAHHLMGDTTQAEKLWNFRAATPLEEGLTKFAAHLKGGLTTNG